MSVFEQLDERAKVLLKSLLDAATEKALLAYSKVYFVNFVLELHSFGDTEKIGHQLCFPRLHEMLRRYMD